MLDYEHRQQSTAVVLGDPKSPDWQIIDSRHVKLRAESVGRQ
jgi:hypothetical protein